MALDGGLRKTFATHLPEFHWQAIETGNTGRGIPDSNYCIDGIEGWIEYKQTSALAIGLRPEQIGWIEKRCRAGGRVTIAIRQKSEGGPRKGPPSDSLWLYDGRQARALADVGLRHQDRLGYWTGGPRRWFWPEIKAILWRL